MQIANKSCSCKYNMLCYHFAHHDFDKNDENKKKLLLWKNVLNLLEATEEKKNTM